MPRQPHQFAKPESWSEHTQYIIACYYTYKNGATYYQYSNRRDALNEYCRDINSKIERCLWRVIREEGQPARLKFLSYFPGTEIDI